MQFDTEEWSNKETWALMEYFVNVPDDYEAALTAAEEALEIAASPDSYTGYPLDDEVTDSYDTRNSIINNAAFIASQHIEQLARNILEEVNYDIDEPTADPSVLEFYDMGDFGAINFLEVAEFFVLEAISEYEMV